MGKQEQLSLKLPQHGGKRTGAGRKPKGKKALLSHRTRPRFDKATPVHVTIRVRRHVWNLRSRRCFGVIAGCFQAALGRFGLRLIEFSVLGNHIHMIVEADSHEALSRGMQGLNVRIAKALNGLMRTRGSVFEDHYHAALLLTPTRLVNAIAYVLGNAAHHYRGNAEVDPFCSLSCDREALLIHPESWLLRVGWRRAKRRLTVWPPLPRARHDVENADDARAAAAAA
jgi:putative transposase